MCNEFRFQRSLDALLEEFSRLELPLGWEGGRPNLEPRASIRPTDPAFLLTGDGAAGGRLIQMRWGFPNPKGGPIINYRSEGRRFGSGRSLIPVDGFYEFTGDKAPKSKWLFEPSEATFLAFAGVIREDRFSILTCEPGPDIAPYHPRQPVILPRQDWAAWLDIRQPQPPIRPAPAGTLKVVQVR